MDAQMELFQTDTGTQPWVQRLWERLDAEPRRQVMEGLTQMAVQRLQNSIATPPANTGQVDES